MNTKTRNILIALAAVAAAFAVSTAVRSGWWRSRGGASRTQINALEQARAVLDRADSKAPERNAALFRLAVAQDAKALEMILDLTGKADQSPGDRALFSRMLGYYENPKAVEKLAALLKDPDPQVRVTAIQSFGQRSSPARVAAFQAAMQGRQLDAREEFFRDIFFYRAPSVTPTERPALEASLLRTMRAEKDPNRLAEMMRIFAQVAGKSEAYRDFVVSYLRTATPEGGAKEVVTLEALRALHVTCPSERLTLLEKFIASPKVSSRIALISTAELQFHAGPQAKALIKKVKAGLVPVNVVNAVTARLNAPNAQDQCKPGQAVPVSTPLKNSH